MTDGTIENDRCMWSNLAPPALTYTSASVRVAGLRQLTQRSRDNNSRRHLQSDLGPASATHYLTERWQTRHFLPGARFMIVGWLSAAMGV